MRPELFIQVFVGIPLLGFLLSLIISRSREMFISRLAFGTIGVNLLAVMIFTGYWLMEGQPTLNLRDFSIFKTQGYEFFVDFCFDKITAVYLLVGSILSFLVTLYSRYYMHREEGYKRFFNTLLFFYLGYNLVIIAGNFETMFIGWEMLGISSFLLIAFYRDRYLPVKNAVKVFSIYRVADVGFLLTMWMSHHLWHENITFVKLNDAAFVNEHLASHSAIGVFISLMILISAAAKSAQLPFSSWLPRAMEGPTPSSAIFYGSLSVHIGVFLLLRTFPFWEHQFSIRILIGVLGLVTSLVATGIARVQSTVKSQIAYSSIAQIGLIFIEVAAGFENLALFHFAGNAFLRTYQLLVSPSVVSYLIREQFYHFVPREHTVEDSLPKRIEYSIYMLCLKEWNLDSFMYRYLWNPMKAAGNALGFFSVKRVVVFFLLVTLLGLGVHAIAPVLPDEFVRSLPFAFALLAVTMVLKSFTERKNVLASWLLIMANHCLIALAVSFNEHFGLDHIVIYLSGVVSFGILGYLGLLRLKTLEGDINLDRFHGYVYEHPKIAFTFLLGCLGIAGFPISPTFLGEDLIFTHIHAYQYGLAFLVALSFILNGLALIRIYARVFLGPHVKSMYEMAYRSS
jgi:NADH:ubiquinone oxidoreductase subunit 5 (subunit L)/multisubunit Na+/H+ antiporter MnhA subunit